MFRRVYQGGHHDVWCDGERHKVPLNGGGKCHADMPEPGESDILQREGKCDCAYWAELRSQR